MPIHTFVIPDPGLLGRPLRLRHLDTQPKAGRSQAFTD